MVKIQNEDHARGCQKHAKLRKVINARIGERVHCAALRDFPQPSEVSHSPQRFPTALRDSSPTSESRYSLALEMRHRRYIFVSRHSSQRFVTAP